MSYFGLQSQIRRNNTNSVLILLMFPVVFIVLTWLFFFLMSISGQFQESAADRPESFNMMYDVNYSFLHTIPWVLIGVAAWFTIAFFSHSAMIDKATASIPLERKENKRVYNLVENLCISRGMTMPKVSIIEDDSLNAFASGINEKTYTVSLSRGIINKLNDQELEAVIAHELTHIRNRDVRLLILSIVFVGIFAFISEAIFRSMRFGGLSRGKKGSGGAAILIALVLALIGYLIASLFRFALSRKREYLADAGSAELTRNPLALASALRKISSDPTIEAVKRKDVAQMFIENPQVELKKSSFSMGALFATHPPIQKRIEILEQF
ncbi:MAG: M48 family metallopeptidase [Bacteroidales bacterium]|jgi:heat shock protein HtpX|nr:M48 family metallopeptidase [Bacteroidales bacterium]